MNRPDNSSSTPGRIFSLPFDQQMRFEDQREEDQQIRTVEILDQIRADQGIGWAIYASAFMGRSADLWRIEICEALK